MECRHKFTMCRLCLCESVSFVDIFQVNELFGYVTAEVIREILQFQVSEMDCYPHVVCSICLEKLTDFKQFKEKCRDSRDTYNDVFASDESHAEHPIDIEEHRPVKLESEDLLDTQGTQQEVPSSSKNVEMEEGTSRVDATTEIRTCGIASTSPQYFEHLRKITHCESGGPHESSVSDVGEPLLKIRRMIANRGKNDNLSGSAEVIVGKIDIKLGSDCKSSGERLHVTPVEKSDVNGVDWRREAVERREVINRVDTSVDAIVEDEETFTLKLESDTDTAGESDTDTAGESEGGEEAPLGIEERERKEEIFRCNDGGKVFEEEDVLTHGSEVNGQGCGEERESQVDTGVNCGSKCLAGEIQEKELRREMSDEGKQDEGVRKYVCHLCGKGFNWMLLMKIHLRVHAGEKPFACAVCDKRFSDVSCLNRHKLTHAAEKPFVCKVCYKGFARNRTLIQHFRIHSGEKPYICEICNRGFRHDSSLRRHLRIHSQEKPYQCIVCNKCFRDSCTLKQHLRVHSQEKPFACQVCKKCFRDSSNLRNHLKVHSEEKPYACQVCEKCFRYSSCLRRHLRIHSQEKSAGSALDVVLT